RHAFACRTRGSATARCATWLAGNPRSSNTRGRAASFPTRQGCFGFVIRTRPSATSRPRLQTTGSIQSWPAPSRRSISPRRRWWRGCSSRHSGAGGEGEGGGRLFPALLQHFCDEPRPAGLVAGPDARPVVAVEVLVEEDQVAPVWIALVLLSPAIDGAAA